MLVIERRAVALIIIDLSAFSTNKLIDNVSTLSDQFSSSKIYSEIERNKSFSFSRDDKKISRR